MTRIHKTGQDSAKCDSLLMSMNSHMFSSSLYPSTEKLLEFSLRARPLGKMRSSVSLKASSSILGMICLSHPQLSSMQGFVLT